MKPIKCDNYYRCPSCESIYEEEYDAETCCPRMVEKIVAWKCFDCDEIYDNEDSARRCCED